GGGVVVGGGFSTPGGGFSGGGLGIGQSPATPRPTNANAINPDANADQPPRLRIWGSRIMRRHSFARARPLTLSPLRRLVPPERSGATHGPRMAYPTQGVKPACGGTHRGATATVVRVAPARALASRASPGGLVPPPGISQRSQDETNSPRAAGWSNLMQEFSLARFDFLAAATRRAGRIRRGARPAREGRRP